MNTPYDGGIGVQTGSSSKLFTLLTALEQGVPFGFPQTVPAATTLTGYTNCKGQPTVSLHADQRLAGGKGRVHPVHGHGPVGEHLLRDARAQGRAVQRGQDRGRAGRDPRGRQVPAEVGRQGSPPADDLPSFTLGAVNVSPMSMAEAYATVAARGVSCTPIAVLRIVSQHRGQAAGPEGPLPPGHTGRCRRRGQLRPAERADGRDRGGPGHRPPRGRQDGHVGQLRLRRLRRLHPRPGRATCRCSTRWTRSSSRCQVPAPATGSAAPARCSARTRPRTPGR